MLTDFVHVPTHSNSMLEAFTKVPQMLLLSLVAPPCTKKNLVKIGKLCMQSLISCSKLT